MEDRQFRALAFLQSWALERKNRKKNKPETSPTLEGVSHAFRPLDSFAYFVISFKYTPPTNNKSWRKEKDVVSLPSQGQQVHTVDARSAKAIEVAHALENLVKRLLHAGLDVEVREALNAKPGRRWGSHSQLATTGQNSNTAAATSSFSVEPGHLLLFVRCPRERLLHEWSRSRLHDWLSGMLPLRRVSRDSGLQIADPLEIDPETQDDPSKLLDVEDNTAERISPSDRQRLIYKLIVGPVSEGYAGVNVEKEQWVDSIFPLHDHSFNKSWIKHWSSKWLIDRYDLRRIREHFGEELAMYFAFLQSYFLWLAIPAVIGLVWWLAGWSFSWQFGILLVLWSVLFTETWARRESDIATYWGVHGVQKVASLRRSDFHPDRYITDPASGETIPFFSNGKRWLRRLLSVPVVLALALLMALFVSLIFALQIFLDEYYDGPFNTLLGFTPIILFSACLPLYTSACRHIAKVLTDYENYEYEPEYAAQYTTKIFVFQFLQDQLYLILTAWVFVPQRDNFEMWLRSVYDTVSSLPAWMVPFLAQEPKKSAGIASASLYTGIKASSTPATVMVQNLLTSFVITNQILNLLTETAIPLLLRWWGLRSLKKASSISKPATESIASVGSESGAVDQAASANSSTQSLDTVSQNHKYHFHGISLMSESTGVEKWADSITDTDDAVAPAEIQMRFAAKVTEETRLPEYNTYEDYAEMASQFGRVTFFSVAWPLAPLAAFLNNWIELRTDAAKICGATKRPIPHRVDTIGPWLDTLRFMCWLSSITNALLIYQFHPNCSFLPKVADPEAMVRFGRTNLSYALVVLLFSEHMFLAIRWAITHAMASWPSAYARIVERSQAQSRRRWLERTPAALRDLSVSSDDTTRAVEADDGAEASAAADWQMELEYGLQTIHDAFKTE